MAAHSALRGRRFRFLISSQRGHRHWKTKKLIEVLSLSESKANSRNPTTLASRKPKPYSDKSLHVTYNYTQMESRQCSGMGDSSSWSPERLRWSLLLCGGELNKNSSFELYSQSTCHFGPLPSLPWPLGYVLLISSLSFVLRQFASYFNLIAF